MLHWHGKRHQTLKSVENFDRLAVIVTFQGMEQLSGVPEILISGEEKTNTIY